MANGPEDEVSLKEILLSINALKATVERQQENLGESIKIEIQKTIATYNTRVESLEKTAIEFQRFKRKNNIIIFGLKNGKDILKETLSEINRLLEIDIQEVDINNIYLIGKHKDKQGIVVEFISYLKKLSVFKNVNKLKGTRIVIQNDLCAFDRERRRTLVSYLKAAKSKHLPAKLQGNHLEINGKKYTVEELDQLWEARSEEDSECGENESESEVDTQLSKLTQAKQVATPVKSKGRKRGKKKSPEAVLQVALRKKNKRGG